MATRTWNGSTSGDWSLAANWSAATVPIAADNVIIPAGTPAITSFSVAGSQNITLAKMTVEKGYLNDIGGSGNPLTVTFSSRLVHRGSGTLWFKDGSSSATALIVINSDNTTNAAQLDCDSTGGSTTKILVRKGKVTIAGTSNTYGEIEVTYRDSPSTDSVLDISSGSVTVTLLKQNAGTITSAATVTTAILSGGKLTQTGSTVITTAYIVGGYLLANNNGATTVTTCNLMQGTLDLKGNSLEKTITTLQRAPGSTLMWDAQLHTISNSATGIVGAFYDYAEES